VYHKLHAGEGGGVEGGISPFSLLQKNISESAVAVWRGYFN